ncbi:unnamed protein product [Blepharisma stoltei]|uniref:Uncharacterized protein n=1 Tax=Blepharisma stoltei TaxID=1481888 RepID=A0AAU9JNQ2_9CILI|nr:unnamed protein product [Blepharisma stoltei]
MNFKNLTEIGSKRKEDLPSVKKDQIQGKTEIYKNHPSIRIAKRPSRAYIYAQSKEIFFKSVIPELNSFPAFKLSKVHHIPDDVSNVSYTDNDGDIEESIFNIPSQTQFRVEFIQRDNLEEIGLKFIEDQSWRQFKKSKQLFSDHEILIYVNSRQSMKSRQAILGFCKNPTGKIEVCFVFSTKEFHIKSVGNSPSQTHKFLSLKRSKSTLPWEISGVLEKFKLSINSRLETYFSGWLLMYYFDKFHNDQKSDCLWASIDNQPSENVFNKGWLEKVKASEEKINIEDRPLQPANEATCRECAIIAAAIDNNEAIPNPLLQENDHSWIPALTTSKLELVIYNKKASIKEKSKDNKFIVKLGKFFRDDLPLAHCCYVAVKNGIAYIYNSWMKDRVCWGEKFGLHEEVTLKDSANQQSTWRITDMWRIESPSDETNIKQAK